MDIFPIRNPFSGRIWTHIFLVILLLDLALPCNPGHGGFRRRGSRKLTPLVFKQHVPNISETTFGASGTPEGRIARDDPRFKDLAVNFNPDIIFKDEEGTGADRIMTQRCKEKLSTLAIRVMNLWPDVKLRVTEAWDEDNMHAKDSLHYEGRAVDITTSDKDRSKYGMLARLAVEAGFDWVYYESRGHIHCSVKSDTSIALNYGGCFPTSGMIETDARGTIPMSELNHGDSVLTLDSEGKKIYSKVILFFHQSSSVYTPYLKLNTESGRSVSLTGNHLIHTSKHPVMRTQFEKIVPTLAENIRIGDYIYLTNKYGGFEAEMVNNITIYVERGMYAPLTEHGTVIVDGFITSCYAYINSHWFAHAWLAPMRLLHSVLQTFYYSEYQNQTLQSGNILLDALVSHNENGVHWYADYLHTIAQFVMPKYLLYQS